MKRVMLILILAFAGLDGGEATVSIGPHFHYTNLKFDEPDAIDGYMAGLTAKFNYRCSYFYTGLEFEGSWDTNHLWGDPCQKSSIAEYFLEWKAGLCPIMICDDVSLFFYTGFGWHRLINEQYPDTISLCYRYDKLFVPLGVYFGFSLCNEVQSALQFEWRPDVYSRLRLHSESLDNKREHAFRVAIPFYRLCQMRCGEVIWSLVPFFDWARFGKVVEETEYKAKFEIPSTRRWELGLRGLVGYQF